MITFNYESADAWRIQGDTKDKPHPPQSNFFHFDVLLRDNLRFGVCTPVWEILDPSLRCEISTFSCKAESIISNPDYTRKHTIQTVQIKTNVIEASFVFFPESALFNLCSMLMPRNNIILSIFFCMNYRIGDPPPPTMRNLLSQMDEIQCLKLWLDPPFQQIFKKFEY